MSYQPNIPNTNDFVSKSQKDILQNYQQISTQFSQDHILTSQADETVGKHKKVVYNEQSGDPITVADEVAFFSKDNAGQPEINLAPESAGTINRVTKNAEWKPGLRVEASVTFDRTGNIIEDSQGNKLSFNVSSVDLAVPGSNIPKDDWIINFTTNISTANYFWVPGWQLLPQQPILGQVKPVVFHPHNAAAYGTSVTNAMMRLTGYQVTTENSQRESFVRAGRINLIIYTVG